MGLMFTEWNKLGAAELIEFGNAECIDLEFAFVFYCMYLLQSVMTSR